MATRFIQSPLYYQGNKLKLLPQLLPLFPKQVNTFIDLFSGSGTVGLNYPAKLTVFNDKKKPIISILKTIKNMTLNDILKHIYARIDEYKLSITNEEGYLKFRDYYNNSDRLPLDLYLLSCFSFNHLFRFNKNYEFNSSFGKYKSKFDKQTEQRISAFIYHIKNRNCRFISRDFSEISVDKRCDGDFFYCDPPYLISTAVYNEKREGIGWSEEQEFILYDYLDRVHKKGVKFALSNVIEHKDTKNKILIKWSKKYNIHYLNYSYNLARYQGKVTSKEVLITNY